MDLHLYLEGLTDHEVAEVADQALFSLKARYACHDPLTPADDTLSVAIRRTCDEWDRFADQLPGFRD